MYSLTFLITYFDYNIKILNLYKFIKKNSKNFNFAVHLLIILLFDKSNCAALSINLRMHSLTGHQYYTKLFYSITN